MCKQLLEDWIEMHPNLLLFDDTFRKIWFRGRDMVWLLNIFMFLMKTHTKLWINHLLLYLDFEIPSNYVERRLIPLDLYGNLMLTAHIAVHNFLGELHTPHIILPHCIISTFSLFHYINTLFSYTHYSRLFRWKLILHKLWCSEFTFENFRN